MAYGGPQRQQQELSRAQMLSPSAVGFRGLVELVGQVRRSYMIGSTTDLDYEDLLVLAIDENSRMEDVSWVRRRARHEPDPDHPAQMAHHPQPPAGASG